MRVSRAFCFFSASKRLRIVLFLGFSFTAFTMLAYAALTSPSSSSARLLW